MPRRLSQEEIVTIRVLAEKGQGLCEVARMVGVSERTVRHHLRRAAEGVEDGRQGKAERASTLAELIADWHVDREGEPRLVKEYE